MQGLINKNFFTHNLYRGKGDEINKMTEGEGRGERGEGRGKREEGKRGEAREERGERGERREKTG